MEMRNPGDRGTAESGNGKDGGFASAPARADAEKDQRQIDSPGDEGGGDKAVIDPARAVGKKCPDDDDHNADGDEREAGAQRAGNQLVERAERREQAEEG